MSDSLATTALQDAIDSWKTDLELRKIASENKELLKPSDVKDALLSICIDTQVTPAALPPALHELYLEAQGRIKELEAGNLPPVYPIDGVLRRVTACSKSLSAS